MVTMNHDYTKGQMIGLAVGFMIIPTVFYGLRVWAKLLVKRFAWDDYLTGAALVSIVKLFSPMCCGSERKLRKLSAGGRHHVLHVTTSQ